MSTVDRDENRRKQIGLLFLSLYFFRQKQEKLGLKIESGYAYIWKWTSMDGKPKN
jgi:hypothetical protein